MVIKDARRLLEEKQPKLPYRSLVVDEAQDFHPEEWKLIRAIVPPATNDLFLVGDAHQRIYGRKVVLRNCGINIQGRSSTLRINYRTTEQIRSWAMAMLQGVAVDDLDGEQDSWTSYTSLLSGPAPEIQHFGSQAEENDFLTQRLEKLLKERQPEDICLVARTNKLVRDCYQGLLKDLGVAYTLLDKHREGKGVRLATMHRVKGLEFPVMILASINAGVMPLYLKDVDGDPAAKAEHDGRERSLLFVAATRARDMLIVTSWGNRSSFLPV
jgi:superfamily I DNA/RNA helicase